jgi:hypothetical protein
MNATAASITSPTEDPSGPQHLGTKKLSLLAIGTTYRVASARQKLISLSDYFNVTCVTSELGKQQIFGLPIREFEASQAIFEHSNSGALCRLLVKARSEPGWRQDLAARQRERVIQVYEHGAVSRTYANFFARIREKRSNIKGRGNQGPRKRYPKTVLAQ